MIRVTTPQGELLAEVDNKDVDSFLRSKGLCGRKISTRAVVTAFDTRIEASLLELKNPSAVVMRSLNYDLVHSKLLEGRIVFISPTKRELRPYYHIQYFFDAMNNLALKEAPVEVVVPAGVYGDRIVFGIRKPSGNRVEDK